MKANATCWSCDKSIIRNEARLSGGIRDRPLCRRCHQLELRREAKSDARTRRTQAVLARHRGKSNEWDALWAILTLAHDWSVTDSLDYGAMVDLVAVAQRLDELKADLLKPGATGD